jgi:broad specificity phosphatase PhoE
MDTSRPKLLVLIRHAESERNRIKRATPTTYFADEEARRTVKGVPDHKIALTHRGHEQALQTGVALRKRFGVPYYFYHSGYLRTKQTTDDILQAYTPEEQARVTVRENHFIRERDPGYTYDMTQVEAETAFPWLAEYWRTFGGFLARPVGGQSLADKALECQLFLDMIYRRRAGQAVFVATHGGTLRCFRFLIEHWDYDRAVAWPPGQSPENCGVTVYRADDSGQHLKLEAYNQVFWT